MRISTVVLGKAVSNAEISSHHVITKLMRKIQSIGQNIERWERDKVQIPGTKIALERAILDTLPLYRGYTLCKCPITVKLDMHFSGVRRHRTIMHTNDS